MVAKHNIVLKDHELIRTHYSANQRNALTEEVNGASGIIEERKSISNLSLSLQMEEQIIRSQLKTALEVNIFTQFCYFG